IAEVLRDDENLQPLLQRARGRARGRTSRRAGAAAGTARSYQGRHAEQQNRAPHRPSRGTSHVLNPFNYVKSRRQWRLAWPTGHGWVVTYGPWSGLAGSRPPWVRRGRAGCPPGRAHSWMAPTGRGGPPDAAPPDRPRTHRGSRPRRSPAAKFGANT